MEENKVSADAAKEQEIVKSASSEMAKKAWTECAALAGKLGGGIKALWAKIHPDRSPEAMLSALNENMEGNKRRLDELKPELERVYREIVAKKKDYQSAPPARQRLLKIELQSLMSQYKSHEREFAILSENERSIVAVKGRFLEVLLDYLQQFQHGPVALVRRIIVINSDQEKDGHLVGVCLRFNRPAVDPGDDVREGIIVIL